MAGNEKFMFVVLSYKLSSEPKRLTFRFSLLVLGLFSLNIAMVFIKVKVITGLMTLLQVYPLV